MIESASVAVDPHDGAGAFSAVASIPDAFTPQS